MVQWWRKRRRKWGFRNTEYGEEGSGITEMEDGDADGGVSDGGKKRVRVRRIAEMEDGDAY